MEQLGKQGVIFCRIVALGKRVSECYCSLQMYNTTMGLEYAYLFVFYPALRIHRIRALDLRTAVMFMLTR